ncbi:MAG TPA: Rieske 2Fe-2S domain-containing protein [Casimicrobiaceae bacterium]|jgi:nitrite reductase/ring-hydroxylating ferredoxin subunit|nr:Rieske 2Fe-2S domain-containing protein [Casimicrobiaceae bacterium]
MPQFVEVARLDEFVAGAPIVVCVSDTSVAVFSIGGQLFAIEDACVRCGASLSSGSLHDHEVTCARCEWQYDVTNGRVNGVPALRIDTFSVRTTGARVMVAAKADDSGKLP